MRRWTALCLLGALVVLTFRIGGHGDHSAHAMPAAQSTAPECQALPLGAVAPAPQPIWCYALGADEPTFVQGANAWVDDFDHGASLTSLGTGYVQGFRGSGKGLHWRHSNHWMVDMEAQTGQYPTLMAAFMKPAQTFRPVNGVLTIEFEVATPIAGTRDVDRLSDSWPELVISTAPEPTVTNPWGSWMRPNGTYLYEAFPQAWTFGCRMQQSRHPICALYRPDTDGQQNYAGGPDRVYETNQNGGGVIPGSEFGGDPSVSGLGSAWAVCTSNQDPDTVCRNLFRFELTATEIKIYVKRPGATQLTLYYRALFETDELKNVLQAPGGVHVFFGDFAYRITNGTVIRFHWDRLAINPELAGGLPPPPTATATRTATPTVTPTAVVAVCEFMVWINGTPTTQNRQTATDATLRRTLGCS